MGRSMDQVHGVVHGVVHGLGPWGGPWTRSMGRSMDPGPCFVYVPSETNEKIYKRYRNRFNKIKETAKKNYYHQKFEEAKGNIRSNWKLINEVLHKTKSKVSVSDQFINDDQQVIKDEHEIATKFNEYFGNIGPNLAKKIQDTVNTGV